LKILRGLRLKIVHHKHSLCALKFPAIMPPLLSDFKNPESPLDCELEVEL